MKPYYKKGFTIIELFIVIALIAIVAAIVTPNFLEAQVGSKNAGKRRIINNYAYRGCATIGPEIKVGEFSTETFDEIVENPFMRTPDHPLSTFSIDVSGSMEDANKLPLVKRSLEILTQKLDQNDRVAIVVYAGASGLVLDSTLEKLADKGNGNYAYIDTFSEARKVFLEQIAGTLITIAKDVKIQVEFNPRMVKAYRLIGYENRKLADEDFNDDAIDAGEIGAGHTVTTFYEIIPVETKFPELKDRNVDPLKYQTNRQPSQESASDEIMTVKLRYKEPSGTDSKLITYIVKDDGKDFPSSSPDFKFAAAVAEFGLLLRNSEFKGNASFDRIPDLVKIDSSHPEYDRRREFLDLVENARTIHVGRVFEL